MLRLVFTPLQKSRAGVWALAWWLTAFTGTYLLWTPIFHYSPFMLFFTAVALTTSRSGGAWGMTVAFAGMVSVLSHPEVVPQKLLVPCASMLFNSGIIIFLGSAVRTGNAQRREDQLFRDSLGEAVADFLWSSETDGRPIYINDRMEKYFGKNRDEILRDGWQELIHPTELANLQQLFEECNASGDKFSLSLRFRKYDGSYRYYLVRGVPLFNDERQVYRWVGTGTDVHEQTVAEQLREVVLLREQKARYDAEQASRLKDEFLATLSHELRTPLNAVFGWMQLLRTGEPTAEELKEGLDVIDRNVRAQSQLVNDLLDMSGIITGKVRLKLEMVDLSDLMRLALESIRPAAEAKQIEISSDVAPTSVPVRGDPARILQVAWNLLNNAVKFTPRGGKVQVGLKASSDVAEIFVTDNGEGVDPEFLPFLFDRFRQADSSPTRAHGGLGLGLAIARQLVELHGGTIQAASDGPGKGATFSIRLPLAGKVPKAEALSTQTISFPPDLPATKERVSLAGKRILIVDDDQDTRNLIRQILESRGAKIASAGSAAQALETLGDDPHETFDAVICDIGMPGMGGHDFIAQVRLLPEPALREIPALALTAFARDEDRHKALSAGFNMYISKPVEPTELLSRVHGLVQEKSSELGLAEAS